MKQFSNINNGSNINLSDNNMLDKKINTHNFIDSSNIETKNDDIEYVDFDNDYPDSGFTYDEIKQEMENMKVKNSDVTIDII